MIAEDFDKSGERTLSVLTKPDLVTEQSAQANICSLILGKKETTHAWILCRPKQKYRWWARLQSFQSGKYVSQHTLEHTA